MIEPIDKAQEARLVDAVMSAIKSANDGQHPNDAIAKVAMAEGFTEPFVQRMVEAFNVSKAIRHHKTASAEDRALPFAIADSAAVLRQIYPDHVASPLETKQASWEPMGQDFQETQVFVEKPTLPSHRVAVAPVTRSFDHITKLAQAESSRLDHYAARFGDDVRATREDFHQAVLKLAGYFRAQTPEPFEQFEKAARHHFGNGTDKILDVVYGLANLKSRGVKRASKGEVVRYQDRTPYELLADVMQKCSKQVEAAQRYGIAKKAAQQYRDAFRSRLTKVADLGFLSGLGASKLLSSNEQLQDVLLDQPGSSEASGMEVAELSSFPDVEAERQGIRARLMLHDMLSNDPVLRRAKPEVVLKYYNDLAQISPALAKSPLASRSVLRKAVEGEVLDPSDISNIMGIEKNIQSATEPASLEDDPLMQRVKMRAQLKPQQAQQASQPANNTAKLEQQVAKLQAKLKKLDKKQPQKKEQQETAV